MFNKRGSCLSRSQVFNETRENMDLYKEPESIRRLLAIRDLEIPTILKEKYANLVKT